jgi:hypothetical protein
LFLSLDSSHDTRRIFEINQLIYFILLGKPFVHTIFMLSYPAGQIVCNADIEYCMVLVGKNVDVIGFHVLAADAGVQADANVKERLLRCARNDKRVSQ